MILGQINYESDEGLQQEPQCPEVYRITLRDLAELHECPICGGKLTPRDKEPTPRKIHDYDMQNKRVIIMSIFRKNYRCTKCKRSCTADSWLNKIRYTEEFKKFVALEVIKGSELGFKNNDEKRWEFETFGKRYEYSRYTISNIAKTYAPVLTPILVPLFGYNTFCLYPFVYNSRERYYLIASKNGTKSMLLGVFGYHNALEEVKTYFNLHKGLFLTQNANSTIYTNFDAELIQFLKGFFVDVKILDELFKEKLEQYKRNLKRKNINAATRHWSD